MRPLLINLQKPSERETLENMRPLLQNLIRNKGLLFILLIATGTTFFYDGVVFQTYTRSTMTFFQKNRTDYCAVPFGYNDSAAFQHCSLLFQQNKIAHAPTLEPRIIFYVHVGKTGGTTLSSVLRANCELYSKSGAQKCISNFQRMQKNESKLSSMVQKAMHINGRPARFTTKRPGDKVTTFLFTVRNPITRAVSGFDMNNPKNSGGKHSNVTHFFYFKCFPTAQVLAEVLENSTSETDNLCYPLGKYTLQGGLGTTNVLRDAYQLKFNYGAFANLTIQKYPSKEIFVVRTEALWEDMADLEVALGGSHEQFENVKNIKEDYGSSKYSSKSRLTARGKQVLCCFLFRENEIFVELVQRAANLAESEKAQYIDRLYDDCGITSEGAALGVDLPTDFSWSDWVQRGKTCRSLNVV